MERIFTPTPHENNGRYYQKVRDGEGVNTHFFDHYDVKEKVSKKACVAYIYSFGPAVRSTIVHKAYEGNTTQRWYYCFGFQDDSGVYRMQIYEVYDHAWMRLDDESGAIQVGTATVKLADKDNIKFSFDLKTPTLQGAGTYELQRLF